MVAYYHNVHSPKRTRAESGPFERPLHIRKLSSALRPCAFPHHTARLPTGVALERDRQTTRQPGQLLTADLDHL